MAEIEGWNGEITDFSHCKGRIVAAYRHPSQQRKIGMTKNCLETRTLKRDGYEVCVTLKYSQESYANASLTASCACLHVESTASAALTYKGGEWRTLWGAKRFKTDEAVEYIVDDVLRQAQAEDKHHTCNAAAFDEALEAMDTMVRNEQEIQAQLGPDA